MSTSGSSHGWDPIHLPTDDEIAVSQPVLVLSCSRLGRRANPPRLSLTDWLFVGRRR